jgi:hypothetical protein
MGGGGGGSSYRDWTADQLKGAVQKDSQKSSAEFDMTLSAYLAELLGYFNGRDTQLVRERLDEVTAALKEELQGEIDQLFGGSVAKHTYVDGLSDIDSLLILDGAKFADHAPTAVVQQMAETLRTKLGNAVAVEAGQMAVSLTYPDGMKIQLLPALRSDGKLHVPSFVHGGWSSIDPEGFQKALVRRNEECGGKLVPTIKLAKAVIAGFPEKYRLSGYHVESLAIAAFRGFTGVKTTSQMLPHFFERSKDLVLSPIRDSTGQSVHVDEYLGDEASPLRTESSHILAGIAKRMRSASAAKSTARWAELFESE